MLVSDGEQVGLRPGCIASDYEALRAATDPGREVSSPEELPSGEALDGHEHNSEPFNDWLRSLRTECTALAIRALELAAARPATAGRSAQALKLMRACLALEPLKESSHRAIMRMLAAQGERAMALA